MDDEKDLNEDFLAIDELRLSREAARQPQLYFRYAKKLADARAQLDEKRGELDVCAAETEAAIRENPENYDIAKVTEAAIKAAIPLQKAHKRLSKEFLALKHRVDILGAAVVALEHRKRGITLLVELKKIEFYQEAEPKVPKAMRDGMEKKEARTIGNKPRPKFRDEDAADED